MSEGTEGFDQRSGLAVSENAGRTADVGDVLYSLLSLFVREQPRDVSMTMASTLSTLRREGPQRITALAAAQGISQPSMTNLISSLEKAGLVVRHGDPEDRRVSIIELTDTGTAYLANRRRLGGQRLVAHLSRVPEEQRETLIAAVPALRALENVMRGAARGNDG